ncbi:hypothetical protein CLV51_102268 [Chitinophaga niastensis]|uniref:Uncharacterized protein n=2 Tax=Chitinophaga niastensis TaxID=536980 RepID=A0A2P8HMI4_CHINA|nr:hypothetical protein CLV51_102268 [Chitinophaga niastensis]
MRGFLIESDEYKVKNQLTYGCLYMILTSVPGIQSRLFPTSQMPVSHINSFFMGALKVSNYISKKKFNPARIDYLRQRFNLPDLSLSDNSFYEQLVFVILNELDNNEVIVVETTGLANDSIGYLIRFCYGFLIVNRDRLIVLVHPEHQRVQYPEYLLLELDDVKVGDVTSWLKGLDLNYLR